MRRLVPKLLAPVAVIAALLVLAATAMAAPHYDGQFKVSSFGSNNKIVEGPDGNMWMTLSDATNDVAKITPAGGVEEFDLEDVKDATGIAVGPEGALWVTLKGAVAKFTTSDPTKPIVTPMPEIENPSSIVTGPDGQMYVATTNGVVHFPPNAPGSGGFFKIENLSSRDIDASGSLLVIAGNFDSRIVTLTTAGVEKDILFVGNETEKASQGLASGPDGQIAFSESEGKEGLGLATPPNPATTVKMPGDPFGVALGSDGAYWFAMAAAKGVERLTSGGQTTALPFPGLNPEFFPRQIAAGPDNTLWVTLENGGENKSEVARVSGLEPPAAPPAPPVVNPPAPPPVSKVIPQTRIGKGPKGTVKTKKPRATVKFSFSSPTVGSTFQCALTHGTKTKKGKLKFGVPKFKSCKAPKSYTLGPGSYRFEVRALGAGGIDPTPAKRSFRVISAPK